MAKGASYREAYNATRAMYYNRKSYTTTGDESKRNRQLGQQYLNRTYAIVNRDVSSAIRNSRYSDRYSVLYSNTSDGARYYVGYTGNNVRYTMHYDVRNKEFRVTREVHGKVTSRTGVGWVPDTHMKNGKYNQPVETFKSAKDAVAYMDDKLKRSRYRR